MRLLFVIHQFFPDCHSGTEQYCLASAREARRRGDEVTVLSLDGRREDEIPPVRIFDAPYDGLRVIRLMHWRRMNPNDVLQDYENLHLDGWFQRVLDEVRPNAVHFFHLRQLGSNLIAQAHRNGLRTVVSLTDYWFLCPRFTLLRKDGSLCNGPPDGGRGCVPCEHPELARVQAATHAPEASSAPEERLAALLARPARQLTHLGIADVVIAPSRFLASVFAKNGFPANRMRILPYGLEPERIVTRLVHRPRRPMRLGFCGVLSPWKAPHVAVEAVRASDLEVELLVYGRLQEPMFQDYINRLLALADGDPRIRFMGQYGAASAADVFAELDALIIPSTWYENTPFVALEAFAAGVPVLASDLGGLNEVVRNDENGRLFAAGDPASLRAAIERIAATADWFSSLRIEPPPTIATNYDEFLRAYRA